MPREKNTIDGLDLPEEPEEDEIVDTEIDDPDLDDELDSGIDNNIEYLIDPENIADEIGSGGSSEGELKNLDDVEAIIAEGIENIAGEEPEPDPDEIDGDLDTKKKTTKQKTQKSGKKATRKEEEWTCSGCFVKVAPAQLGSASKPVCPQGQSVCPAIDRFF